MRHEIDSNHYLANGTGASKPPRNMSVLSSQHRGPAFDSLLFSGVIRVIHLALCNQITPISVVTYSVVCQPCLTEYIISAAKTLDSGSGAGSVLQFVSNQEMPEMIE